MKGIECFVESQGFYGVYYPNPKPSQSAIIAMAGDSCTDYLARKTVQWLHGLGLNVLAMSFAANDYSCHDYPLEHFGLAIDFLHQEKNKKIAFFGASTTGMAALLAASYYSDISLTFAISPSDFVMEGYYQIKGVEQPGNNESTMSWKGNPLPYLPYAYRHPQYWNEIQAESKRGKNMIASREMFDLSEKMHPITEQERIKVENIQGTLVLLGAEDDCLWDTCKYIRRMERVLKQRDTNLDLHVLTYEHGTHFLFPQSLMKMLLPFAPNLLPKIAFKAGKDFSKECKAARMDMDVKVRKIVSDWILK